MRSTSGVCALLAAGCSLAFAPATLAQVMEVGDDGKVTVYDGPTIFRADGAKPINPPRTVPMIAVQPAPGDSVQRAADAAALSPELVAAVAWQESRLRPGLTSRAGAVGEMQLMPATARALGVDPRDSAQNYRGGATFLAALMRHYDGDLVRTLAAYNAGPGAVDRYGGTPPYRETRAYVSAVLERLSQAAVSGANGR